MVGEIAAEVETPKSRGRWLPALPSLDFATPNLSQVAKDYVAQARAHLRDLHSRGGSGTEIVSSYTTMMDRLITFLFDAATQEYVRQYARLNQTCTAVAQGGYGRGELSPYSDIDLLFLHEWKVGPYVEFVVEKVLHSLFDAQLTVGFAVRNVRDCVRLAGKDPQVKTSLLDARYVRGDKSLYADFSSNMMGEVFQKNVGRFLKDKVRERVERLQKYGESVYLLEPHVKEGKGGLRDMHTALWMAKVKYRVAHVRELMHKGVTAERALVEVERSRDFLLQVRNALHFLACSSQDRLTFEAQEKVAADLGFLPGKRADGAQAFMHQYYRHATVMSRFAQNMEDRCLEKPRSVGLIDTMTAREIRDGVRIVGSTLSVTRGEFFRKQPENLIGVFHDAQRHGVRLSNATKELIRDSLSFIGSRVRRLPAAVEAFGKILAWKRGVFTTLQEMHTLGVLGRFVPEFSQLVWRTQREPGHMYTVDEHCLMGVRELERLRTGEYKDRYPLLTQAMREIDKVEILFLAMLFHDIGKALGQGHSERGAAVVRRIARRWHLNQDDATQWEILVRHHLLMAHLAQHRDFYDDSLVSDFVRKVGNLATLKKLYLLTFADMKAVGPSVWNTWMDMLLGELYLRALERFEKGTFEDEQEARAERVKKRLARSFPAVERKEPLAEFLRTMPDNYFLTTPEESMPRHLELMNRLGEEAVVTHLEHFPEKEYSEWTVVTRDHPGLFATIAGVLTAHGMNIASARITTSARGIALDAFRISHVANKALIMAPEPWERIRVSLEQVLRGELEVHSLVESRRPSLVRKPLPSRVPTEVTIDNAIARNYTVLDVSTQDRLGLLFTITHCLFRLGLVIHLAKVTTNVDKVLDVFYVTDLAGEKITDEARLRAITAELSSRLERENL